jgi:Cytochrome C oxidase, cbb3-type, subunit III
MKMHWFMKAAIAAAALCSASGLLYAQDAGDAPVPVTRNVWTGVYSIAQARRGQETYYQVCASCHGRELEGDDSEGVTPLAGAHFMTNWDTHTVADLVKRIHAQPNDEPGDIDVPTQVDLFAFIMAFNQVPSGNADLPPDRRTQAEIGITAQPPAGITPNAMP